jgi:dienelactone hydrolase
MSLLSTGYSYSEDFFEGTSRVVQEQGVVGKIFYPFTSESRPAVIVLTGSNGGMNEAAAKAFAADGYVALALAYFRSEGVPKNLDNIPLEYFLHAIRWLKVQSGVLAQKICLYGTSRGGELVLLLGSVYPNEVQAIIAVVPFCVTNGGVPDASVPAWTLQGKPFPIAPFPEERDVLKQLEKQNAIHFTSLWLEEMQKDGDAFNNCMIRVENIKCNLLLISGSDDRMCPSWVYSNLVMERLERYGSTISKTHLCYEGAGHLITNPNYPVTTGDLQLPYEYVGHKINGEDVLDRPKRYYAVGGTPEKQAFACKDSWEKILDFLALSGE